MQHQFEIGDYLEHYGSIVKVTQKAICVSVCTGLSTRDIWIPKSALIVYKAINRKGLLNDDTKHLIVADFHSWFRLKI